MSDVKFNTEEFYSAALRFNEQQKKYLENLNKFLERNNVVSISRRNDDWMHPREYKCKTKDGITFYIEL